MRVVFNRQSTLGPRTGIGHYTAELLHGLQALAAADEIHPYPTGWLGNLMEARAGGAGQCSASSWSLTRIAGWALGTPAVRSALRGWLEPWKFRHFRAACRRHQFDLYHEPNILPMPADCPTVITLHDLSAIVHPEWHPADRVRQYERHLQRGLSQAVHCLTGSDYTRREIIEVLGLAPERVTRIYHGVREGLGPMPAELVAKRLHALGLPPRYLLHVGTLEPRKNLDMLVRAYCRLPGAVRERCPLLLVGKLGWMTGELAVLLEGEAKRRGVLHLGYLAEEDLPFVYNGAQALVFPSLYEGFGLPPLEMLACGGAVLASAASAVPEVMGNHGHLINPLDAEGWRAAMERVVMDIEWRESLRRGGCEWAAPFTWRCCAAATLALYRRVTNVAAPRLLAA